ncbi:MAG TPA: PhoX family phosphatase [Nocardioidaceae bacterium]|nr:PhoX family phosphatase [Nocardioidaceae bacterium]
MTPHFLPLIGTSGPHGSRSAMTCKYRCANQCDHPDPNQSGNPHIQALLANAVARRTILAAGATVSAGAALAPWLTSSAASAAPATSGAGRRAAALTFAPVEPNKRDNVTVPVGYDYDVVASWGDRVLADAPEFDAYHQTPKAQAGQFGYNCDYVGAFAHPTDADRLVLTVNHEYTDEVLMFPASRYSDQTILEIAMQAHGMSIVEIVRGAREGSWRRVRPKKTKFNRRLTATTPFAIRGPAAGDKRMKTSADSTGTKVLGMVNNCAGGMTPWGTVLTCEENFNGYFDASGDLDPAYAESYARYGIAGEGRGWSDIDSRFDLTTEPHEVFRFGWVIEIDPFAPKSTPVKHTMLGRLKHEGANPRITTGGQVAVYLGDDERGDYIYKFVSAKKYRPGSGAAAKRHNMTLLETGTLYVARFTGDGEADGEYDGTGEWIALTTDTESYVEGMSVADVLIDTRLAADKIGATRMDRPEDMEANPVTGKVYAALTNNSDRGAKFPVDEANPLASSHVRDELGGPLVEASGNRNGYVLELSEDDNDAGATGFGWLLFLVCGDPEAAETYFGGYPKDRVSPISCPDNVAFDPAGNLWISTDGNVLGSNDGMFAVPTEGANRGQVLQFLTVPLGAETCGPLISSDGLTVFNAVQHPGEIDGATFEEPASTWPHTDRFPRPAVICSYRIDGARVGH